jgi:hypothetical protein
VCCSVALQALYSDGGLWSYAITVIAFLALGGKFIWPCGIRINTAKGLAGFAVERYKRYTIDSGLWRYAITFLAESYKGE